MVLARAPSPGPGGPRLPQLVTDLLRPGAFPHAARDVRLVETHSSWGSSWPAATPVEPAVWMRRLPESGMLRALLTREAADEDLLARLARRLASFHAAAPTGPGVDEHGGPTAACDNWEQNFRQTRPFVGRTFSADVRDTIRGYIDRFLTDQQPLLERRVAEGRVREGHGDLHVDSVCVARRRLYLFESC